MLAFFDTSKDLTLQVDASKYGLGAVLLQEGKPLAYASKSLTDSEINYAQIKKELLAILWGCKGFHQYIYGRHITVESDHKPLEAIIRKPLSAAPPRLQRMILQLQKYSFTIVHVPGKNIPVADTMSRKLMPCLDDNFSEVMDVQVHTVLSALPVSDAKLSSIQKETEKDAHISTLRRVIKEAWPNERKRCPTAILDYWNHRDELSEMDGTVFKGEKIVILTLLREEMIKRIHSGHMGIEKSKQRVRDILFWPGMSKQIAGMVEQCSICLESRMPKTKEPLISHPIPNRPWQTVGTDLFNWNNEDHIVVVDYYSRYLDLEKLKSTTAAAVILKLKKIFAAHGIPEKVISDDGPQFSSKDFENFARAWDFVHVTSSPHYPQSNGLSER